MRLAGQAHRFRRLPWERLLPASAAIGGFARVTGVRDDDLLQVRSGPHVSAPTIGSLAPNTRCVPLLDVAAPPGMRAWRAVALADGQRGWVNGRFLDPTPVGCG